MLAMNRRARSRVNRADDAIGCAERNDECPDLSYGVRPHGCLTAGRASADGFPGADRKRSCTPRHAFWWCKGRMARRSPVWSCWISRRSDIFNASLACDDPFRGSSVASTDDALRPDRIRRRHTIYRCWSLASRVCEIALGCGATALRARNEAVREGQLRGTQRPLVESEPVGHRRGAFTGARARQVRGRWGTILLDEVGELLLGLQAKLQSVIHREIQRVGEDRPHGRWPDPAATNRKIEDDVDAGHFREDLYYRLAGVACTSHRYGSGWWMCRPLRSTRPTNSGRRGRPKQCDGLSEDAMADLTSRERQGCSAGECSGLHGFGCRAGALSAHASADARTPARAAEPSILEAERALSSGRWSAARATSLPLLGCWGSTAPRSAQAQAGR